MIRMVHRVKAEMLPALTYEDAQAQAATIRTICETELAAITHNDRVEATVCGPTYLPSKGNVSLAVGWFVTVTLRHDPGSISATTVLMGMLPSDHRFSQAARYALAAARRMRPGATQTDVVGRET